MILEILGHPYHYEAECILRLFFPREKISVLRQDDGIAVEQEQDRVVTAISQSKSGKILTVSVTVGSYFREEREELPDDISPETEERRLCTLLFQILCQLSGQRPPWGILTGIRPVRRCHRWKRDGMTEAEILETFQTRYLTTCSKAELALETARHEAPILALNQPNGFSLYVSIPFCPTRCAYCSFVSHDIQGVAKLVPEYLDHLCRELQALGNTVRTLGLKLQTVYIGGGTPTTLQAEQLERLLSVIDESFDRSHLLEYTVEAGRPDTITREKLRVLRRHGVDRLSVNPQTLEDRVLEQIGRRHTVEDFFRAYELARKAGFSVINTDLIAGLPGETPESFLKGLEQICRMDPGNITIHTLTVKRSSRIREEAESDVGPGYDLSNLLDRGRDILSDAGYHPYYLYRQKGTYQNLENVGFAKQGMESAYNVFIMEEVHTILAAGAGGVTKLCDSPGKRIQRIFNFKFPYEYLSRFDQILQRKSVEVLRRFYHEGDQ